MEKSDQQILKTQESVAEKATYSVVNLLANLGFNKKNRSFEGRKALWNKYYEEIKGDYKEGEIDGKYRGSSRQNVALIRFFEKKIVKDKSIVDTKTGEFRNVGETKKEEMNEGAAARSRMQEPVQDLTAKVGPKTIEIDKKPVAEPDAEGVVQASKAKEAVADVRQIEKIYDEEEKYIKKQIDIWTAQNESSPFDTGPSGADGTQRGRYRKKGRAVILDNITGKKHRVNIDPSKADRVKDYVTGKEKVLTGEPLVCIDAAQKLMSESFQVAVPRGNRRVAAFERFAATRGDDYEVYHAGVSFDKPGQQLPKLPVACKPGDIITLGYKHSKGRHVVVVTKVDKDGLPMECVNSSSSNSGVGKRPFFNSKGWPTFKDYKGDDRSIAMIHSEVIIKKIIRPRAIHDQYLAYKKKQEEKIMLASLP